MTNVTVVLTTHASQHRYTKEAGTIGTWAAACEHAYESLHRALAAMGPHLSEIEITQLEPVEPTWVNGLPVMRWSSHAHLSEQVSLRADVLDDLPRDEAAPSMARAADRHTPPPRRSA